MDKCNQSLEDILESLQGCINRNHDCCDKCYYSQSKDSEVCLDLILEDCLYWLNNLKNSDNLYHQALAKITRREEQDFQENLPLDWDKLKTMVKKPVLIIEYNDKGQVKTRSWYIIDSIERGYLNTGFYKWSKKEMGKIWFAYKKEPDWIMTEIEGIYYGAFESYL